MVTVKDITKAQAYPNACKDGLGQSFGSAPASAPAADTDERVEALVDAGADIIVVDTAHGHSERVLDRIRCDQAEVPAGAGYGRQHRHRPKVPARS